MRVFLLASLLVLHGLPAVAAGPVIPEPDTRLLVPGGLSPAEGTYLIGLELDLPAGWHSYWRNPGDAGIAPRFSFETSSNLKALDVIYPAPERYFDGFSTSITYHDRVVFPLKVTPVDAGAPVELRLSLDYGYCREVCVPGHAALEAELNPEAPADATLAAELADALARVPVAEAGAPADAPKITAITADDALTVSVTVADPLENLDLFVEGPEGWYFSPADRPPPGRAEREFKFSLDGLPQDAMLKGAELRLTLVGEKTAVDARRRLD